jgi:hypothetical protein
MLTYNTFTFFKRVQSSVHTILNLNYMKQTHTISLLESCQTYQPGLGKRSKIWARPTASSARPGPLMSLVGPAYNLLLL